MISFTEVLNTNVFLTPSAKFIHQGDSFLFNGAVQYFCFTFHDGSTTRSGGGREGGVVIVLFGEEWRSVIVAHAHVHEITFKVIRTLYILLSHITEKNNILND